MQHRLPDCHNGQWSEIAQWVAAWTTQFHLDAPSVPAPILYMPMGYAKNIQSTAYQQLSCVVNLLSAVGRHINKQPNVESKPINRLVADLGD